MPKPDARAIGERLYQERVLRHMSTSEVGSVVGCTAQTVANYEAGRSLPDVEAAWKLADLFGLPLDVLVGRAESA